ncbi:MAG TPA: CBS domain-containing protein [Sphingobacteriaceae bacterium]|nr:CBS domain-containing protein [Sphingobacteriaceae bacterium]
MKYVKHVLQNKASGIISLNESCSVYQALEVMMENNISAVLIMEDTLLKGIFTERDYARKIILQGKASRETLLKEVMTKTLLTVTSEASIADCMNMMTDRHIRHLPVIDKGAVTGMVSIGDVVKFIIQDQQQTIQQLESYISS